MSNVTKAALKAYFETGDFPTQTQFSEMIENIPEWITVSLTAAQIKTGFSIPIDAVAAPGAGKAIEVVSASVKFTFGGTEFTSNTINLKIDTSGSSQYASKTILLNTSNNFVKLIDQAATANTSLIENKGLKIITNADSAVGDGTAKVYILYRIITI